jgi:hypothetical protein
MKAKTPLSRTWGRAAGAGVGLTLLWLLLALLSSCGPGGQEVTKAEYGDAWPFSVDQGTLICESSSGGLLHSAVFRTGEEEYALNAVAEGRGYPSVEPIWRNKPQYPGVKTDLAPLVDRALQQC